ncbi:MAG: LD-carboxypeptidase, partial [Rhodothermales bacterium]|nr:LD-carboxypeptidase [Rhodothermales bacterium]
MNLKDQRIIRAGVVAPASAPLDPSLVNEGIDFLRRQGLVVQVVRDDFSSTGYLAGIDSARADELNDFLRRTDIDLLFCVRGGYGTLRILDQVDYEAAARHPKLLVGYSDITALQLALYKKSGLVSVSGPMVAVEFAGQHAMDQGPFWDLLSASPPYEISSPTGTPLKSLSPGECEGVLLGGNLSVLTRLLGTGFEPHFQGAILFLEEIG